MFSLMGIVVTLSGFVMLCKSCHSREYLRFLGRHARKGPLPEDHLTLMEWPGKKIQDWRRGVLACAWIGQPGDILKPWLFQPRFFMFMWVTAPPQGQGLLHTGANLILRALSAGRFYK